MSKLSLEEDILKSILRSQWHIEQANHKEIERGKANCPPVLEGLCNLMSYASRARIQEIEKQLDKIFEKEKQTDKP